MLSADQLIENSYVPLCLPLPVSIAVDFIVSTGLCVVFVRGPFGPDLWGVAR